MWVDSPAMWFQCYQEISDPYTKVPQPSCLTLSCENWNWVKLGESEGFI